MTCRHVQIRDKHITCTQALGEPRPPVRCPDHEDPRAFVARYKLTPVSWAPVASAAPRRGGR